MKKNYIPMRQKNMNKKVERELVKNDEVFTENW